MNRARPSSSPEADGVTQKPLRILQIGTIDDGGGAAAVANGLMRAYRERGCCVRQAVGRKTRSDPDVVVLPDDRRAAYRWSGYSALQAALKALAGRHPNRGWGLVSRSLRVMTHPRVIVRRSQGIEDFDFPGTYDLLDVLGPLPDIVHCHNLHGGFFDLGALSWISQQVPTVLTLHDMWLLTGHCAHSLGCERWRIGCGQCPDLKLYPSIRRDATAANWLRKRGIYANSRLHVATPSQWLLDKVQQSMLAPALADAKVIPNGVDLSIFRPGDKLAAREALGIRKDAAVVLMTAGSDGTMWKDDRTLITAIRRMARHGFQGPTVFMALGRELPQSSRATLIGVPYQSDLTVIAKYFQAADLYAHSARADNFPSAVLEALACGTPVVATDIGGIPEQLHAVDVDAIRSGSVDALSGGTGVLVPPGNVPAMADAIATLLGHPAARGRLGVNGTRDARARFDLQQQVDTYLAWYRAILSEDRVARD